MVWRLHAELDRVVGFARGEPRGGGACRELHRSSWGGIVEVECPSIMHGAALKRLPPRRETSAFSVAASLLPHSAPDFANADQAAGSPLQTNSAQPSLPSWACSRILTHLKVLYAGVSP